MKFREIPKSLGYLTPIAEQWALLAKKASSKSHFCLKSQAATECILQKNMFLNIFTKCKGKYLCQSLFFNKVAGISPKFLRALFLRSTSGQLLLKSVMSLLSKRLGESIVQFWYLKMVWGWASILWKEHISCHWSLSIPPESIRKPEVFRCFQGV